MTTPHYGPPWVAHVRRAHGQVMDPANYVQRRRTLIPRFPVSQATYLGDGLWVTITAQATSTGSPEVTAVHVATTPHPALIAGLDTGPVQVSRTYVPGLDADGSADIPIGDGMHISIPAPIGGHAPITAARLARIPVALLAAEAVAAYTLHAAPDDRYPDAPHVLVDDHDRPWFAAFDAGPRAWDRATRDALNAPRPAVDQQLQRVADVYLAAVKDGHRDPVNAVALDLGTSKRTAQRRVQAARSAGHDLPPAPNTPKRYR